MKNGNLIKSHTLDICHTIFCKILCKILHIYCQIRLDLPNFTKIKKFLNLIFCILCSRIEDKSYTKNIKLQTTKLPLPATKQFNCGLCLHLMTLKEASKHKCIIEFTDDPQGRFLVIDQFQEFYPITEGELSNPCDCIFIGININFYPSFLSPRRNGIFAPSSKHRNK